MKLQWRENLSNFAIDKHPQYRCSELGVRLVRKPDEWVAVFDTATPISAKMLLQIESELAKLNDTYIIDTYPTIIQVEYYSKQSCAVNIKYIREKDFDSTIHKKVKGN